jgi:hypothetical protein
MLDKIKKITILLTALICGCTSVPFRHSDYISFQNTSPQDLRINFSEKIPERFELLNGVVFKYKFRQISTFGITDVDTASKSLKVAGFNHLGVMLFDLALDNGDPQYRYVFPELNKKGNFAQVALGDIKNIYFDRIPSPGAQIKRDGNRIIFKEDYPDSRVEYIFGGEGPFLAEKDFYENDRKIWSVSYYDYIFKAGLVFPKGIILRNYKYGYQLLVSLKEVR